MKLYQKIILIVVVSVITICGGIAGWISQFLIVGVAFFISAFVLINNKRNKYLILLFLLSPFLLMYGVAVLIDGLFREPLTHVHPIVFISFFSAFLGFGFKLLYIKYSKKVVILFASLYLVLFMVGGYVFMCNWLHYVWNKRNVLQSEKLSDLQIWDFEDNEIKLEEMENKVFVFDFWSLNCRECFRKFPDLEKVKKHYQNKEVVFYAAYIPRYYKDDDEAHLIYRLGWIEEQNFTFQVVKTDTLSANRLGVRGVPQILVFDKNKRIVLSSNTQFLEKKFIINNIYSTIDKLLEE